MEKIKKEYEVYPFDELSEEAKEEARLEAQEVFFYDNTENNNSLDEFQKIFPVKVTDWKYGECCPVIYFTINDDENLLQLTGIRLLKYLYNNYGNVLFKNKFIGALSNKNKYVPIYSKCQKDNSCVLTGYCMDDEILQPIYNFLKKPNDSVTFYDLISQCLNSWVKTCSDDYDHHYSDENLSELLAINDYRFLKTGKIFKD